MKSRARWAILNEILSFPTVTVKYWNADWSLKPQVGDLVSMHSAPASKWYLSWLRDIDCTKLNSWGGQNYLLESIEDESLGWWTNIGLKFYDRKEVSENPTWQWTDRQFQFNDRWFRVCEQYDTYMVRPSQVIFGENNTVTLSVQIRWHSHDYTNPKTFPNWKKVTKKYMEAYFETCLTEYSAIEKSASSSIEKNK